MLKYITTYLSNIFKRDKIFPVRNTSFEKLSYKDINYALRWMEVWSKEDMNLETYIQEWVEILESCQKEISTLQKQLEEGTNVR